MTRKWRTRNALNDALAEIRFAERDAARDLAVLDAAEAAIDAHDALEDPLEFSTRRVAVAARRFVYSPTIAAVDYLMRCRRADLATLRWIVATPTGGESVPE
ncbi:hypothetical protein [Prescottella agglutinans]|uniref:Uncharacterized protein n=1 Tax=Prescottella agglutinans TaxID=1644129 RepID=A0ABT6ME43_9NOCA|nr:hypothetical protein [Prescottella agglutinans]MDH6282589.1 hypothetical protein [Prescottella agglutinans]